MAIKRILLPFCDAAGFTPIAEAAFVVGQALDAQVRVLFAQPGSGSTFLPNEGISPTEIMRLIEKTSRERAEALRRAREMFDGCARRYHNVDAVFASSEDAVRENVGSAARLADISVLGSGAHYGAGDWTDVREGAIFGSGRPVLLAPTRGLEAHSLDRVVIAWKDSIEMARAFSAAQPFLARAKTAYLVAVGEDEQAAASLSEAEQYLQLHNAELRSEVISSGSNVGETLLRRCRDLGGALLVMGAYSHSRWRERVFGGVTQHVLDEAQVPVVMAH